MRRIGVAAACAAFALLASACGPETSSSGRPMRRAPARRSPSVSGASSAVASWECSRRCWTVSRPSTPTSRSRTKDSQDDDKITQAIAAGNASDVGLSFSTDIVGKFCSGGAWQDLSPTSTRDKVDLNQIPDAVRAYTEFKGKRCTMPLLADAYGLYYNKDDVRQGRHQRAAEDAGASCPRYAKKLTVRNPDGSIKVAGFLPASASTRTHRRTGRPAGAPSGSTDDGKSAIGTDPAWKELLKWQKELIDWYGYDKLDEVHGRPR